MRIQTDTVQTDTETDHRTTDPTPPRGRQPEGGARASKWLIGLALAAGAAAMVSVPSAADEPVAVEDLDPHYERYRALLGDAPEIDVPDALPLRADEILDPHYEGYRARLADGASSG